MKMVAALFWATLLLSPLSRQLAAQDDLKVASEGFSSLTKAFQSLPATKDPEKKLSAVPLPGGSGIVYQGPCPSVQIPPIPTLSNKPVKLCVRVWAELANKDGRTLGRFVNIDRYKWSPDQYFYFWVETATPIQFAVMQTYEGPTQQKQAKCVIPDVTVPQSYQTVFPGKPVRFPVLIKTDPDQKLEVASIVAATPGAPVGAPQIGTLPINNITTAPTQQTFQQTNTFINTQIGPTIVTGMPEDDRIMSRLQAVHPQAVDPAPSYNDIATVLFGTNAIGFAKVEFHK